MWLGSVSGGGGLVTSIEGQEMEDLKDVSQERNIFQAEILALNQIPASLHIHSHSCPDLKDRLCGRLTISTPLPLARFNTSHCHAQDQERTCWQTAGELKIRALSPVLCLSPDQSFYSKY